MAMKQDYMVLINPENALPQGFEETVERIWVENPEGSRFQVEKKTYEAFLKLQADVRENDGLEIALLHSYRSIETQEEVFRRYETQFGLEYASKYAARPGHSEHHTGLALDLYLIIDGKDVTENEEMVKHPEIWEKIHAKLPEYGFILRYTKEKEDVTGYSYEPWHIRYVGSKEIAKEITDQGLALEEYLEQK
jgi:D-alanyl-D-alanine carboxypeptidase